MTRSFLVTMPPLWFLRYAYFLQAVKDSKLEAKIASSHLESYVTECWKLKDEQSLDHIQLTQGPMETAISTLDEHPSRCPTADLNRRNDWCAQGICWMEEMPDDMLEQVIVLSTICLRWYVNSGRENSGAEV